MTFMDKLQVKLWRLLPPNFPTDLAEAFDDAKRAFWKAAAPAEVAKEKGYTVYLRRELQDCYDRIEELESAEPGSELDITRQTNLAFRLRLSRMQDRIADLEIENQQLKERLSLVGE